jgi:hypothetical protein
MTPISVTSYAACTQDHNNQRDNRQSAYNSFVFVILQEKNVLLNPTLYKIKNNMGNY